MYEIRVRGKLPFYVPVPPNIALKPTLIGAEPFILWFHHFQRKPKAGGFDEAINVDDGQGTFVYSDVEIAFPQGSKPVEINFSDYLRKGIAITNKALTSIRLVSGNHTIRNILSFTKARVALVEAIGGGLPKEIEGEYHQDFGPHGISPIRTLSEEGLQSAWLTFNGLRHISPAWILILDAKYYADIGEIEHALFDLATALEIGIKWIFQRYKEFVPSIKDLDIEGKNVFDLYDEVLMQATGESLHNAPELFIYLEYIRTIRNSIAHEWKAIFAITLGLKRNSKYLAQHEKFDGKEIDDPEEVKELVKMAGVLLEHIEDIFLKRFGNHSL